MYTEPLCPNLELDQQPSSRVPGWMIKLHCKLEFRFYVTMDTLNVSWPGCELPDLMFIISNLYLGQMKRTQYIRLNVLI